MSSALRLSIIAVLLLATTALGLIAYRMNQPGPATAQAAPAPAAPAPATPVYFVAKHPLTEGTLVRDEHFGPARLAEAPSGAFLHTPDNLAKLRGALVRNYVYGGNAITSQDVMPRNDPGFLAALEKLCQAANTREKTTVTVHTRDKATDYSVRKTDSKASAACDALNANYQDDLTPTDVTSIARAGG